MQIKDSGKRQAFEGGAVRDVQEDKPRPDLICPHFLRRLGLHLARGAKKYAERNWELGMPQSRAEASLCRHYVAYMAGQTDEDHLAAMAFNVMMLISQEERINVHLLSDVLSDGAIVRRQRAEERHKETQVLPDGTDNRQPSLFEGL